MKNLQNRYFIQSVSPLTQSYLMFKVASLLFFPHLQFQSSFIFCCVPGVWGFNRRWCRRLLVWVCRSSWRGSCCLREIQQLGRYNIWILKVCVQITFGFFRQTWDLISKETPYFSHHLYKIMLRSKDTSEKEVNYYNSLYTRNYTLCIGHA